MLARQSSLPGELQVQSDILSFKSWHSFKRVTEKDTRCQSLAPPHTHTGKNVFVPLNTHDHISTYRANHHMLCLGLCI